MTDQVEETKRPKRLIILDAIEAGGATKESLMELADCSAASLATNFSYLRMGGKCPLKNEDDTYSIVTEEEWAEIKAEAKAKAKTRKTATPKTPEQIYNAAQKRVERTAKALETATKKHDEFPCEITELRLTIATADARLADIALDALDAPEPIEEDESAVSEALDSLESDDLV
jgi:hypothetical protein